MLIIGEHLLQELSFLYTRGTSCVWFNSLYEEFFVKRILSISYLAATAAIFCGASVLALNSSGSIVPAPMVPVQIAPSMPAAAPVAAEIAPAVATEEVVESVVAPEVAPEPAVVAPTPKPAIAQKTAAQKDFVPATRIAFIDFEEVLMTCDEAKDQIVSVQQELRGKAEDLGKRFEDLEKRRAAGQISPQDYAKERGYIEVDQRDLEGLAQQRQYDVQKMIAPNVVAAINKVSDALPIDAVAPKFFYSKESAVITDRVREEMNKEYTRRKKEAKFKKSAADKPVAKPATKPATKPAVKAAAKPAAKAS